MNTPLAESYRFCDLLSRREAKNFYYSFRLLPTERRVIRVRQHWAYMWKDVAQTALFLVVVSVLILKTGYDGFVK